MFNAQLNRCTRLIGLAALTATLLCGIVSSATAHTLSAKRAELRAQKVAYAYADVGEYYDARSCTKVTSHQRRCVIWTYMEETGYYCDAYTMVWFKYRGGSYRTTHGGWYQGECSYLTSDEANGDASGWKWNWYGPLTQWPTIVG